MPGRSLSVSALRGVIGAAVFLATASTARAQTPAVCSPADARPVSVGDSVGGDLTAARCVSSRGTPADLLRLTVANAARLQIDAISSDLDSYLEVMDSSGTNVLYSDDDAGSQRNARVVESLPPGTYYIQVTSWGTTIGRGQYALSVRPPAQTAGGFTASAGGVGARVAVPRGGFDSVGNSQVGRAYLVGDKEYAPSKGNLPFGVILLRRSDSTRNRALCSSFVNNISTVEDIRAADPNINIIATYWLLNDELSAAALGDCDELLSHYNYTRAQRILAGYGKASSPGPVFLALQLNTGLGVPANVFLLDLARETPENVAKITMNWFNVVVDRSDDQAAATTQVADVQPVRKRGGGFFRKLIGTIARVVGGLSCDALAGTDAAASAPATAVYEDPTISAVKGTLRVVLTKNMFVSFGSAMFSGLVCPHFTNEDGTSTADPAIQASLRALNLFRDAKSAYERRDYSIALPLLEQAAALGNASALSTLASMYLSGKGVVENLTTALQLARQAAEKGDAQGQYLLGMFYELGRSVQADLNEAIKHYRIAAAAGDAQAKEALRRLGVR